MGIPLLTMPVPVLTKNEKKKKKKKKNKIFIGKWYEYQHKRISLWNSIKRFMQE